MLSIKTVLGIVSLFVQDVIICIEPRTEPSFCWLFLIYIRWFCSSDIYSFQLIPANLVYFAEK
jgi:hypothetical protein